MYNMTSAHKSQKVRNNSEAVPQLKLHRTKFNKDSRALYQNYILNSAAQNSGEIKRRSLSCSLSQTWTSQNARSHHMCTVHSTLEHSLSLMGMFQQDQAQPCPQVTGYPTLHHMTSGNVNTNGNTCSILLRPICTIPDSQGQVSTKQQGDSIDIPYLHIILDSDNQNKGQFWFDCSL